MNVFVVGASGAIGRPLVAELVRRGHTVTGMTRSEAGAEALAALGASVARVSAFDAPALERALRESKAEAVIDELTALPKSPADMAAAAEGDRRLRLGAACGPCPSPSTRTSSAAGRRPRSSNANCKGDQP